MRTYEEPTESAYRRRIEFVSEKTNIPLQRTRRNGRPQKQHLKLARFARDMNYEDSNGWINKNGAPSKKDIVQQWRLENPNGKKADCIRETGLTKPTVYKWWDEVEIEKN